MEWLASLWYEMIKWLLDSLMELFTVDLSYFAGRVPVINDIATIFVAVGWALLIGNLAYQAVRAMVSGVGIEAEDPGRLFLRTAMFSFLLLVSRPICNIGLGISSTVMTMLQVPAAVTFEPFSADYFDALPNAGWLIVIIVNVIIQWQLVKLFFEVAERYVILCLLTYLAPLAFAMGGSKSTGEIFRGWVRMFSSMCALMVFNLMFVKLVLSALSNSPNGAAIIPWTMLTIGIVRMAKKMDGIILRIGMNPALTGDPLGSRLPGMVTMMALRTLLGTVSSTVAKGTPPAAGMAGGSASAAHATTRPVGRPKAQKPPADSSQNAGTVSFGAAAQSGSSDLAGSTAVSGTATTNTNEKDYHTVGSIHNRPAVNTAETARRVRDAISIDANDFDEDYSAAASGRRSGNAPVMPPITPASASYQAALHSKVDMGEHPPRPAAVPTPDSHAKASSVQAGSFSERPVAAQGVENTSAPRPTSSPRMPTGSSKGETWQRAFAENTTSASVQAPHGTNEAEQKRPRPISSPAESSLAGSTGSPEIPKRSIRPASSPAAMLSDTVQTRAPLQTPPHTKDAHEKKPDSRKSSEPSEEARRTARPPVSFAKAGRAVRPVTTPAAKPPAIPAENVPRGKAVNVADMRSMHSQPESPTAIHSTGPAAAQAVSPAAKTAPKRTESEAGPRAGSRAETRPRDQRPQRQSDTIPRETRNAADTRGGRRPPASPASGLPAGQHRPNTAQPRPVRRTAKPLPSPSEEGGAKHGKRRKP